jgi:thioredoxin-like negative regulator of GroEL
MSGGTFVADDFPHAVEEARRTKRPIFVDAWAVWCKPCREMQAVFDEPRLRPLRERFVWTSIDIDRTANAAFLEKYPSGTLPKLWVIDAESGKPILEWRSRIGAETLERLLLTSEEIARHPEWSERTISAKWIDTFERAASDVHTADERVAFDAPLLEAYFAIGSPERALPMLRRTEHEFPRWHEPPTRLARVHLAMGDVDQAEEAIERAAKRAPDHARGGVMTVREAILALRRARD